MDLFLFVNPVDVFRNEALHDSTLRLQDLKDKDGNLKLSPLPHIDLIAEHLCWIALDCAGVPNKMPIECM